MSVSYIPSDGSFSWEISSHTDSLCYYKINNYNPNRHTIKENSAITIHLEKNNTITLTGKELYDCIDSFKAKNDGLFDKFETQNILLRNLIRSIKGKEYQYLIKEKKIQSFLYINDNDFYLIILDKVTSIDGKHYQYKGNTLSDSIPEPTSCKVQFFGISDYSYMQKEMDKNGFHIDNINYAMKTSVVTTEWGAGHVMLKPDKDNKKIEVKFPKSIIYIDRLSKLKESSELTAGLLSFKQMSNAFPATNTFYLPLFSKEVGYDVCQFQFYDGKLHINDTDNHSSTIKSSLFFYPDIKRYELKSGSNSILCRAGYINQSYILSYFFIPFIIFISILIASNNLFSFNENTYSTYYKLLTIIAFIYCICKIFIAIKLSYSYPYFEKMSGIIVVSTSLTLVLFFLFSLIINHDALTNSPNKNPFSIKKKGNKRKAWNALFICTTLFALSLGILYLMDRGINKEMLSSYMHTELYPGSITQFLQSAAINDTHRSIWIMLSFVITIGMFILLFMNIFSTSPFKKMTEFLYFRCNSQSVWEYTLQYLFYFVMIPCVFIGACGLFSGNFATAFISLICIIGLSKALTNINLPILGPIGSGILMVLVIPLLFIVVAMIPDHGYLTNYFGFIAAAICFYLTISKYTTIDGYSDFERRKNTRGERIFINSLLVAVVVLAISLPSLLNSIFNPEEISYDRLNRRAMLFSQYDKLKESGYRYAESDTEFMSVMSHYMYKTSTDDPLCNDEHILHSSVSSGQSPVVLNDVSIQAAFFGAYGWKSYVVYFGLLLALSYLVLSMSLHNRSYLDTHTQWRLLAMLMWLSCSFYIFMSYIDWLPFTGRLNPGFGVDSVGEALESALLLGFMSAIALSQSNK